MSRARTIAHPDHSQHAAASITWLAALLTAAALALAPLARVNAQSARASVGRASLHISASVAVPVRLKAEAAGAPVIVAQDADFTTVDVPVRVAANMRWTLQVRAAQAAGPLQVLGARGSWVPLDAIRPVPVLDRRAATNPATFNVRVRIPAGDSLNLLDDLRLLLRPAGT